MSEASTIMLGSNEEKKALAQSVDTAELDAAQPLMPILGFLPAPEERMRSAIDNRGRPHRARARAALRARGGPQHGFPARVPLDVVGDLIQPFPAFSEVFLHALLELRAKVLAAA